MASCRWRELRVSIGHCVLPEWGHSATSSLLFLLPCPACYDGLGILAPRQILPSVSGLFQYLLTAMRKINKHSFLRSCEFYSANVQYLAFLAFNSVLMTKEWTLLTLPTWLWLWKAGQVYITHGPRFWRRTKHYLTWGEKRFPTDVSHSINAFDVGILEFVY